jgi:hypothetical protein
MSGGSRKGVESPSDFNECVSKDKGVFGSLELILSRVTSNASVPIRKTKHKLIIKLTA